MSTFSLELLVVVLSCLITVLGWLARRAFKQRRLRRAEILHDLELGAAYVENEAMKERDRLN